MSFRKCNLIFDFSTPKEIAAIDQAHDSIVWALAWHPLGHILCSGSNDHSCKFWTRNHPGDSMRDKYNLNTMPASILGFEDYEDGTSKRPLPPQYLIIRFPSLTRFYYA